MARGKNKKKLFNMFNLAEHEFPLLIETQILKSKDCSCFKTLRCCIYPVTKG